MLRATLVCVDCGTCLHNHKGDAVSRRCQYDLRAKITFAQSGQAKYGNPNGYLQVLVVAALVRETTLVTVGANVIGYMLPSSSNSHVK
jgi:hypothetical protein